MVDINPEHYFVLCDGRIIKSLEELMLFLKDMDQKTFTYHVNDQKNDFSNWIRYVFKEKKLADEIYTYSYGERKKTTRAIKNFLEELKILVINAGSSSLKFQLLELTSRDILIKGMVDAINLDRCTLKIIDKGDERTKNIVAKNHDEAMQIVIQTLLEEDIIGDISEIKAVGHRVVHGGEEYKDAVLIDNNVIEQLRALSTLAPLHNPANISCIIACQKFVPAPQVAIFDTAFHSTIPQEKYLYGLPYEYYEKDKIRKYGFHGSSHKYITGLMKEYYGLKKKRKANIIICHLGNGCSITAVKDWKSFNTSMGFTPADGLIMGTRSGHLDPCIGLHLSQELKMDYEEFGKMVNKRSGLLGICGYSDMRDLHKNQREPRIKLAMDMFVDRITHYIGAYIAELNGVDAIVFTAGIGENAFYIRKKILDNFKFLRLKIDEKKNAKNEFIINRKDSKIEVFVIGTNEELQIAMETRKLLKL